MTTSSAQDNYSITLTDEQLSALNTITLTSSGTSYSTDTITLNNHCYTSTAIPTVCFTGNNCYSYTSGSTISIGGFSNIWGGSEWINSFPEWTRIEKMCEEYPSLKLAFEKFKNTYNLVKDDFDAPPEKRIKP